MTWRLLHDSIWWTLAIAVTLTAGPVAGLFVVLAAFVMEDCGV